MFGRSTSIELARYLDAQQPNNMISHSNQNAMISNVFENQIAWLIHWVELESEINQLLYDLRLCYLLIKLSQNNFLRLNSKWFHNQIKAMKRFHVKRSCGDWARCMHLHLHTFDKLRKPVSNPYYHYHIPQ